MHSIWWAHTGPKYIQGYSPQREGGRTFIALIKVFNASFPCQIKQIYLANDHRDVWREVLTPHGAEKCREGSLAPFIYMTKVVWR